MDEINVPMSKILRLSLICEDCRDSIMTILPHTVELNRIRMSMLSNKKDGKET